jgi:release factor glutamine methyltransferase
MNISRLLEKGVEILNHSSQTPNLDVELLLGFVLDKTRSYLIAHSDDTVKKVDAEAFLALVKDRGRSQPIAYITRKKEFYGLDFYVDEHVLIPRPETEQLVDMVLTEIKSRTKNKNQGLTIRLIDVGTGSGAIGISIISEVIKRGWDKLCKIEVCMTDISGKALQIAKRNYKRLISNQHNIDVTFSISDLLKGFRNKFDIIVSNPPYIPEEDIEMLDKTVCDFEPMIALSGGKGGLEITKILITQALPRLNKGGVVLLEIHEEQPNDIQYYIAENYPNYQVSFCRDCFKMWRFAKIREKM